jgi:hypothetical protein
VQIWFFKNGAIYLSETFDAAETSQQLVARSFEALVLEEIGIRFLRKVSI